MPLLNVSFSLKNAEVLKDALLAFPQEAHKAAYWAIRETTTHVKSRVSVHVRKRYRVPAATIKKTLDDKTPRFHTAEVVGMVEATSRPLLLTQFEEKSVKAPDMRRESFGPFKVKLLRNGSYKPVIGLFINAQNSPNLRLRPKSSRYPTKPPAGPSIPQMIENEEVWSGIEASAEKKLNARLAHQLNFVLNRIGAKL